MASVHGAEDAVGARLYGQVQEGHQLRDFGVGADEGVAHVAGVGCGVAQAFDAVDCGELGNEDRQFGIVVPPSIDVLAEQGDFACAGSGEAAGFLEDCGCGA